MRDNKWLGGQLKILLDKHFNNLPLTNPIEIKFGREAKYRFGSIKLLRNKSYKNYKGVKGKAIGVIRDIRGIRDNRKISNFQFPFRLETCSRRAISNFGKVPQKSIITITSMFARENVPVKVVQYTIAHELCHYAHGFSSANKQLFKHPHHGGIVNKELTRRGAEDLIHAFKKWLKIYRKKILARKTTV